MANIRKPAPKPASAAKPAPVAAVVEPAVVAAEIPAVVEKVETVVRQGAEQAIAGARDAQEQFRKAVEQGMSQSRAAYDKLRVAAEEATGSLETSYSAATKGVSDLGAKAIDALKAQSEASLEHFKSVMAAKSIVEAFNLQTAHARSQFEIFTAQAREMTELAQKVATAATEPLKATFAKSFAH